MKPVLPQFLSELDLPPRGRTSGFTPQRPARVAAAACHAAGLDIPAEPNTPTGSPFRGWEGIKGGSVWAAATLLGLAKTHPEKIFAVWQHQETLEFLLLDVGPIDSVRLAGTALDIIDFLPGIDVWDFFEAVDLIWLPASVAIKKGFDYANRHELEKLKELSETERKVLNALQRCISAEPPFAVKQELHGLDEVHLPF